MRFLALAVLLGLPLLAALWQKGYLEDQRERRRALAAEASGRPVDTPDGWSLVLIGKPSGAEPVERPPKPRPRRERSTEEGRVPAETEAAAPVPGPTRLVLEDFQVVVREGQVLSQIVKDHYGRVSPRLEGWLAAYNGLESPDKLRAGKSLALPSEEKLTAWGEARER